MKRIALFAALFVGSFAVSGCDAALVEEMDAPRDVVCWSGDEQVVNVKGATDHNVYRGETNFRHDGKIYSVVADCVATSKAVKVTR